MEPTFAKECLDQSTARSAVTATDSDRLADSHDGDHGVVQQRRNLERSVSTMTRYERQ